MRSSIDFPPTLIATFWRRSPHAFRVRENFCGLGSKNKTRHTTGGIHPNVEKCDVRMEGLARPFTHFDSRACPVLVAFSATGRGFWLPILTQGSARRMCRPHHYSLLEPLRFITNTPEIARNSVES